VSSENPAARSLRKGSKSVDERHPACFSEGAWLVARLCCVDPSGVRERSSGKNSAGPRDFLPSAIIKEKTHPSGCGNMVGSSRVMPIYEMMSPRHFSTAAVHDSLSAGSSACRDVSRTARFNRFQQPARYSNVVSF